MSSARAVAGSALIAHQEVQDHRPRKLRRTAETAGSLVETGIDILVSPIQQLVVDRTSLASGRLTSPLERLRAVGPAARSASLRRVFQSSATR